MKKTFQTHKSIRFTLFIILIISSLSVFAQKNVHSFTVTDIDGKSVNLSQYDGKVLLIVNVASKCGFTPQYESLEAFYKKYKSKGLVILGFPANNFMSQEPGANADIKQFCSRTYNLYKMATSLLERNARRNKSHELYRLQLDCYLIAHMC